MVELWNYEDNWIQSIGDFYETWYDSSSASKHPSIVVDDFLSAGECEKTCEGYHSEHIHWHCRTCEAHYVSIGEFIPKYELCGKCGYNREFIKKKGK